MVKILTVQKLSFSRRGKVEDGVSGRVKSEASGWNEKQEDREVNETDITTEYVFMRMLIR